jgi:hypothetical protein
VGAIFDPLLGQLRSDVAGTFAGVLPIANGGTGSATQNFVDLSSTQSSIGGAKTFTGVTTISATSAGPVAVLTVNNNTTSPTAGFAPIINYLAPNLPNGDNAQFRVGVALSTYNAAEFNFNYISSGNSNNAFYLGLYGATVISFNGNRNTSFYGNVTPNSNNTYDLGSTSKYWSNIYGTTHNFNSTASIGGSVAGTLTFTGTVAAGSSDFTVNSVTTQNVTASGSNSAASGTWQPWRFISTISQSGTAGYTCLTINPTESSTGSGTKRLLDLQVGGTTKFNVDHTGIPQFAGTNTTGTGSAALGANSPATTNTAPYTWIEVLAADGSTVYIPAWK